MGPWPFWEVIKNDLMVLFHSFFTGELDLYMINFASITLIPKEENACTMRSFRPISLLNCNYKIFTKVLTNRINIVADRLISSKQSAFIKGRYILESVVTAHEILHSVHQLEEEGAILKLDYGEFAGSQLGQSL